MKTRSILAVSLLLAVGGAAAQVAVDADGRPFDEVSSAQTGDEGLAAFSAGELSELVAPIALYPDDLLAIVLPASTYPLQIVEASRFLKALEQDPSLEPDSEWDDTVVALLNYPEVIELLNEDLDWTWQLGEAVVTQQDDVIGAVEDFRDRAYAAGNLKSDDYQEVSRDEGIIEIVPVTEDVIHVPYYEPEHVVVRQAYPVYHYYSAPRPVYYYPYDHSHAFRRGYFWGVTTAFTIGWATDRLHVHHHSYRGHPYYGRRYYDRWWYRRPSISVYQATYVDRRRPVSIRHYDRGDYWRSNRHVRMRLSNQRVARTRSYQDTRPARRSVAVRNSQRDARRIRDRHADTRIRRDDSDRRNLTRSEAKRGSTFTTRQQQNKRATNAGQSSLVRERERNLNRRELKRYRQQNVAQRRMERPRQPSVAQRRADRPRQPTAAQRQADRPRAQRRDSAIPRTARADRPRAAPRNVVQQQRRDRSAQNRNQRRESRAERAPRADRRERQRGRADRKQARREVR